MKKCIPLLLLLFAAGLANGATINIGPGDAVNWSIIQPGDVIQLSAGNYSGGFLVKKSGTAAAPITIKGPANGTARFTSTWDIGTSNYVTIDGGHAEPYGISVDMGSGSGGSGMTWGSSGNVTNLTVKNMELIGCSRTSGVTWGSYGMNFAPGDYDRKNLLVSHCRLFQWCETFRINQWKDCVIEFSELRKMQTDNVDHADVVYNYPSDNVTFRYNSIWESPVDGIFFEYGGARNWKFYGNWYWASQNHLIFFKAPGTYGPLFIYNNVFYCPKSGNSYAYISKSSSTIASGSQIRNNVFYNVTNDFGSGVSDYNGYAPATTNGYGWPKSEPHSFEFSGTVFTDAAGGNFRLTSAGKAAFGGKGYALAAPYDKDADGNRFDPSAWDVGAFVASGGSGPSPSPTSTPAPSPTATPTPPPAQFAVGDNVKTIQSTNIRTTPAGTLAGTQPINAAGTVQQGPSPADFNGVSVQWYKVDFANGVDGWCGDDNLTASEAGPTPSPTPSPSPSPTPGAPTYEKWILDLNDWIRANPPSPDKTME